MKIFVISDLHLEFFKTKQKIAYLKNLLEDIPEADLLIIAGDLDYALAEDLKNTLLLFKKKYNEVIYVPGNHEYYETSKKKLTMTYKDLHLRSLCMEIGVHYLNCETVTIGGLEIAGCTLWSRPTVYSHNAINDQIGIGISLDKNITLHESHLDFLTRFLKRNPESPKIIVTHHLPSSKPLHSKFLQSDLNPSFCSEVASSLNLEKVKLWACGHSHEAYKDDFYFVNPVGYSNERKISKLIKETVEINP